MPGPRGSGSKRGGTSTTLNGHANHSLSRRRSQRLDPSTQGSSFGRHRSSIDVDCPKSGSGDSTPDRDSDTKAPPGSSTSTSSGSIPKDASPLTNILVTDSQKRIHVGQSPGSPIYSPIGSNRLTYASVLPPHQYLDSLAITFFLVNLPTILLVLVHLFFVIFAVSPHPTAADRYSFWKTILPAEAFIVLFFALASPSIRAYITELAEPVIASTLAGNGGRGTAICAVVMFATGRIPDVFGGLIRLRRYPPGALRDTIVLTAHDLETENEALDRLGDELQAWVLALVRQLIAIHVVARWSWEGLKRYLTNRVNQSKLEDISISSNVELAASSKRKKSSIPLLNLSRMPLWTTIANNYIIATKDAELKPPEDLSSFMLENECALHIREITSCSVRLCAKGQRQQLLSSFGPLDSFDVCVNGLQWREISISLEEGDRSDDETLYNMENICLSLDIHSLPSSTANEIEVTNFSLPDPNVILFHATICTTQREATAVPILAPQTVRPSSPISTLTDKLNNVTEGLSELKNSHRRVRKDHKSTVASLRSEIDTLHSRLEAPDKGEERARRGNLASGYYIKQTEDKIRCLEEDIRLGEEIIALRQKELLCGRDKWESERSALDESHRAQNNTKSSYDNFLRQFHGEKMAINARKERLTSREVRLKSDLQALETAERKKHEELDDRSKKRQEARNQLIKERQAKQAEQIIALKLMENQFADIKERTSRTHAQRLDLESLNMPPQQPVTNAGSPTAPVTSSSVGMPTDNPDAAKKGDISPEILNDSHVGDC